MLELCIGNRRRDAESHSERLNTSICQLAHFHTGKKVIYTHLGKTARGVEIARRSK